jgi:hypothetical protein
MNEKSKKNLGIYLGMVFGEAICVSAFYIEIRRATGGNTLSWVYVVEWPFFALYIIYMWRRLLKEGRTPFPLKEEPFGAPEEPEDPALIALNEYYLAVHGLKDSSEIPKRDRDIRHEAHHQ